MCRYNSLHIVSLADHTTHNLADRPLYKYAYASRYNNVYP